MENGKVVISQNPIKTRERIDVNGNIINPITKQIIVAKEEEYVPPVIQITPPIASPEPLIAQPVCQIVKDDPKDIQKQIEEAEANLLRLKELKKVKIEEIKKQLAELEK